MTLGQILRSVREQRHFSLSAVAKSASISEERLLQFEADQRRPSYRQLTILADVYGVAPYIFVSETLPNLPGLPADYRKRKVQPAHLSPAGMKRIWAVEERTLFAKQLSSALKFAPAKLLGNEAPKATAAYAKYLRRRFDDWFEVRADKLSFAGPNDQRHLAALRLFFEVQGVLVNINTAPEEDYTGFYVRPEEGTPAIFVNRVIYSKKAQLFTIAHEYCHHIIGEEGVSNPFLSINAVERQCNAFAADFLAPLDDFQKLVEALPKEAFASVDGLIRRVSRRSLLSLHASALRLVEAEYINQSQLNAWLSEYFKFPKNEKDAEDTAGGGAPHAKRIGEVGYLSTYLAKLAVDKAIIDGRDVRDGIALAESLQPAAFELAARRFDVAVS